MSIAYETFSDSLFTSIENGINTFQNVINNKTKDIVGDSIKVVEFIGTALDQNEIMRLIEKKSKEIDCSIIQKTDIDVETLLKKYF